ncbi:MAG: cell division protein ZapA [Deltaproteobacteria bacterium]|nr:cell division protein ZapA [Deltaproteobacteria bacterium]
MKTYEITIGRETFPIKSDASEAHVKELAREIQSRYDQMNTHKGPRASQGFRAMTMVALVLLDELLEMQQKHSSLKKESVEFATRLTARIDAVLDGNE